MDVQINEMTSTVRATDSQVLLNPTVLEQIIRMVLERQRQAGAHERRVADERRLRESVSGDMPASE